MSFTWNKFYGRLLKPKIYIHCSVVWEREWEKEYILRTLCSILAFNFCQMHQNEAIVTYQIGLFIEMMIEVPTWTHWKSFITEIHEWIHVFFQTFVMVSMRLCGFIQESIKFSQNLFISLKWIQSSQNELSLMRKKIIK